MNAVLESSLIRAAIDAAEAPKVPWHEMQPLLARIDPALYPVDSLPTIVRLAAEEVAGFVKAPMPLIAVSAMAALSLAIQAHTDVERAERLTGPCGLFMLAIADSGERKSTCDGFFTKSIREYETQAQEDAKPLVKEYETELEIWEAKRAGLKERIKSMSKDAKPTAQQERELHDLTKDVPTAPRVPRLIYGDATPEALQHSLAKRWPSGGVVSSEAGSVFGSHGMGKESVMRNLAALNQLWDGASLPVERRSSESYTVKGARLTMALQVQESTLRAFFESSKGLARGSPDQLACAGGLQ
jgi:putative DNA primase/helicase